MYETILIGIGAGVANGIILAVLGYAKSKPEGEEFDKNKLVQTVVVGGVVGGIAGYSGITYTQSYEWLSTMGAVGLIEYGKKAIWRTLKNYLKK